MKICVLKGNVWLKNPLHLENSDRGRVSFHVTRYRPGLRPRKYVERFFSPPRSSEEQKVRRESVRLSIRPGPCRVTRENEIRFSVRSLSFADRETYRETVSNRRWCTQRRRMRKKPPSTEVLETRIVRASTRSLPKDTENRRGQNKEWHEREERRERKRGASEFHWWSRSRFELSNKNEFVFLS